jgi:polar amino acid transport system substrate-binding protein
MKKNFHKIIYIFVVLLPTLAFSEQPKLTVFSEHLPPYQIQGKDGNLTGLTIDIFNELTNITGITADIKIMSWARAFQNAKDTPNSLIFSMVRSQKREDMFLWVGDIIEYKTYFWGVRNRFKNQKLTFEEIKQYTIASPRSSSGNTYLQHHNFPNIYTTVSEEQVIKMIYKERADFFIAGKLAVFSVAKKLSLDISKLTPVHEIKDRFSKTSIAFNLESDTELVKKFQQAFIQLKESGKLKKYREKWGVTVESPID